MLILSFVLVLCSYFWAACPKILKKNKQILLGVFIGILLNQYMGNVVEGLEPEPLLSCDRDDFCKNEAEPFLLIGQNLGDLTTYTPEELAHISDVRGLEGTKYTLDDQYELCKFDINKLNRLGRKICDNCCAGGYDEENCPSEAQKKSMKEALAMDDWEAKGRPAATPTPPPNSPNPRQLSPATTQRRAEVKQDCASQGKIPRPFGGGCISAPTETDP